MSSFLSLRVDGLEDAERAIQSLAGLRGFKRGLLAGGQHLRSTLRRYPPPSRRSMEPYWKNAEHKRKVIAMIKMGLIDVPYRRGISPGSEDLQARWAVEPQNGGLSVVVGNNASYAEPVQGLNQAPYHQGTWDNIETIANRESGTVMRLLTNSIAQDLRR